MTMTQTVRILPNSRTIEIPREIPAGEVIVAFTPVSAKNYADMRTNNPEQSINPKTITVPQDDKGQLSNEAFRQSLRYAQGAWKNNPWSNHLEDVNAIRDEWEQRN